MNPRGSAPPLTISAAAALAVLYALVLIGVAGFTAYGFAVGSAVAAHHPLTRQELKGVLLVIVLLVAAGVLLVRGAIRLVTARSAVMLVTPLAADAARRTAAPPRPARSPEAIGLLRPIRRRRPLCRAERPSRPAR